MIKYAGIGSRATPVVTLDVMKDFAAAASRIDSALLRSGGAPGADTAFEKGVDLVEGAKEIYLPWARFGERDNAQLTKPTRAAMWMAAKYHPGWEYLRPPVKLLMARNCHQVLGSNLDDPVDYVICWTPDGSLDGHGIRSGGTGQALRIASDLDIEVINMCRISHEARILQYLESGYL